MRSYRYSQISLKFLIDILERWRARNSMWNTKTETMSLVRSMIRILSHDDHFNLVKGGFIKSVEYKFLRRIDGDFCFTFFSDKIGKFEEIRLLKFLSESFLPAALEGFDLENRLVHVVT